jgi:hypothetical protein
MVNPELGQCEPEEIPNIDGKDVRRRVLNDMKEIGRGESPKTEEDWDLVWVLSGPPVDIEQEIDGERNESKDRLETGFNISREVTALRLGKSIDEINMDDILNSGPKIYWNAEDEVNDSLRKKVEDGLLEEKYSFPRENLIISQNSGIRHTGHQFRDFPEELAEHNRKIVIVSDTYHLPRVKRYLRNDDSKITKEKAVLYPSNPRIVLPSKAISEIKKIPEYIEKGILPPEQ